MLKAYAFPEWTPDLANNVLSEAINVRAIANGYAPVKAFQAVTTALAAAFNGGGAFIDSTGNSTLLASTATDVYKYTGAAWAAQSVGAATQVNRFAQFGNNVIVAKGGAGKSYALLTGVVTTPTAVPNLIDVAHVRDFVMGITDDNAAQWCQFNNTANWTTGTAQADKQPSLWGQMRRIIGGEYAVILTDRSVVRVSYVGDTGPGDGIIFQFDQISAEVGCMAAGSVCNVGRLIFFLSERGFMMSDGAEVTPIADEKFNRWFFENYSREDIAKIWAAIDPRNSQVLWAMPGSPGRILIYNWVLKRATVIVIDVSGLFTGYTAGASIDALDAIHGNLDAIPISLDDPSLQGGSPILLIANASNALGALTGANLAAVLKLKNIEPTPGKRSRVRGVRLVADAPSASATLDARMNASDAENIVSTATMRSNGKLPMRANGRYNTLAITIPAGTDWSYVQGCEIEFEAGDGR